nr:ORF3 [Torque teno felis virus]
MPYGERCRETSAIAAWFPNRKDQETQTLLKPKKLLRKDLNMKRISGPKTSTQTGSSQIGLLEELLSIVEKISDANWKTRDDLDISMTSSGLSSETEASSSDSDFETVSPFPGSPPPTPTTPSQKKAAHRRLNSNLLTFK